MLYSSTLTLTLTRTFSLSVRFLSPPLAAVLAIGKCLCPKDLFTARQCAHARLQSETDRERKICRGDEWEFSFLFCLLFVVVVCVCVTAVQHVSVMLSHRETSVWILDLIWNITMKTWSRKGWLHLRKFSIARHTVWQMGMSGHKCTFLYTFWGKFYCIVHDMIL